ncbi:MAG: ribbon-helix-helix protein, CopG family [Candidatus Hermodarchaeota archaeon]
MAISMATCKLLSPLIREIDNQVRKGNYLSRSEFIRYAIKSLEKNPFLIDTNITFMDQLISQVLNGSVQEIKLENKVVSFKLPHESANRLNSLSEEKQVSRSEIIRLGITLLLKEEQTL